VTDSTNAAPDRERDVFVTSFDMNLKFANGRKPRAHPGALWNVFLGSELIDHFEEIGGAIDLARRVSTKSGRPVWRSSDGVTFEPLSYQ
jgi:hypothetical protein